MRAHELAAPTHAVGSAAERRPSDDGTAAVPRWLDYLELTKPRVNVLVLLVTAIGYYLGSEDAVEAAPLFSCLLGTLCLGAGASTLNQYMERRLDALMRRTGSRPLAAGRLRPWEGLALGALLGLAGSLVLAWGNDYLAGLVGAVTFASYVFVYTPLKRWTALSLYLGAIPGALPPLIGWAAARGELTLAAWTIFAVMFVWQIPHFAAIGWLYREDYRAAGFAILSVGDRDGAATSRQMLRNSVLLLFACTLPYVSGVAGALYALGSLALGAAFLGCALRFAVARTDGAARLVLLASLAHLPAVFLLLLADKA